MTMDDLQTRLKQLESLVQQNRRETRKEVLELQEKNIRLERELILLLGQVEELSCGSQPEPESAPVSAPIRRSEPRPDMSVHFVQHTKRESEELRKLELMADKIAPIDESIIKRFTALTNTGRATAILVLLGYSVEEIEARSDANAMAIRSRIGRLNTMFKTNNRHDLRVRLLKVCQSLGIEPLSEPILKG